MIRYVASIVFAFSLVAACPVARAHFLFVVPETGQTKATVIMNEVLEPGDDVEAKLFAGTSLSLRRPGKPDVKLELAPAGDHAFRVDISGADGVGAGVVHGQYTFGVQQRGRGKPFLLVYYPKAILGSAFDERATLGDDAPAEIVPTGKPGELVFMVMSKRKPAANAKVVILLPNGKEQEVATDGEGKTPAFKESGRYGVWARCVEPVAGTHAGKQYEEIRRYPTLVVDVGDAARAAARQKPGKSGISPANIPSTDFPKLPEPVSSFGAAAANGWLYVYGGHTAATHHYDTNAVSGKFHRIPLAGGTSWEALESGPALQGMNIVARGRDVYRVGGMQPRNKPGDEADNHSVADVARFDARTLAWKPLPSLPQPRSSHDAVVVGDRLIVVGGWTMKGAAGGNEWPATALALDLTAPQPRWQAIEQPFRRRALIAAVHLGKVYVIGGFDEHDDPSVSVEIFDPTTDTWSPGPQLPTKDRHGFAPAACSLDGKLYVSVMDGTMYRLRDDGKQWDRVAKTTPRIVHRLIPHDGKILALGGADRGGNFDLVEVVDVAAATTTSATGGVRVIPIEPRLYELLSEAVEHAGPNQLTVCGLSENNLRRDFAVIRERAGLTEWAEPFQVMRRNRETDWAKEYPQHAVSEWLGHDITVSAKFYLNVTDDLYRRVTKSDG